MHEQAGIRLVHTVMKWKLGFYTELHVKKQLGNRTWLERNSNIYLDLLLHLSWGRLSDTLFPHLHVSGRYLMDALNTPAYKHTQPLNQSCHFPPLRCCPSTHFPDFTSQDIQELG